MSGQIFKIVFQNQDQVFEVYARQIFQSELYGFIEVEEFVFGEKTQVIVDPSEEKLKNEFAGVKRSFIPMHSVIRIDEVDSRGTAKITENNGSNVTRFPTKPDFGSKPPV
ncbi:Uncharacterised protein [BD1-7 clade bacterium]|uniref:DUF1820 domain-containing protein n=1 Tax=BD1-7 clade bacterium TaxID=2029982 RepID=A0A5S9P4B7_9GAMM|nr:Uncharacterised protein [BD1-7 clade bacterium]CAA0098188.1 Uncharacterised protein [BD1-7 clade bacterium]